MDNFSNKFTHLSDLELFDLISNPQTLDVDQFQSINRELARRKKLTSLQIENQNVESVTLFSPQPEKIHHIDKLLSGVTKIFHWYGLKSNQAIWVVGLVLCAIFLLRSYNEYAWIRYLVVHMEWLTDLKMFVYVTLYAILPFSIFFFLRKKPIGWIMIMNYIYINLIEITWSLYTYWNQNLDMKIGSLDSLIPHENNIHATLIGILSIITALLVTRGDIREIFSISRKRMFSIMTYTAIGYVVVEFLIKFLV